MSVDFRAIFESLPGLCLILAPDHPTYTIVAVSDAYLRATMTTRHGIIGRGLFEVFPDNPDDVGATGARNLAASLRHVLSHREPHTMAVQKYDIRRPTGEFEERHWSPVNSPVFGDDGSIIYIVHRVEDVTEFMLLKRSHLRDIEANQELRGKVETMMVEVYRHEMQAAKEAQARAESDAANAAKDKFLAMLSHELRTPLTPVVMTIEALAHDPDVSQRIRDDLQMVRRNIELETRLIDDLLDLSRVTSGKLQLQVCDCHVHELLRHVLASCAGDITSRRLDVRFETGAENDSVAADSSRLQQVLWNILRNAIKYTPEGGNIRVGTHNTHDGQLRVDLADSGMGIPAQTMPHIFDAFVQSDSPIARRTGGLGLGLAIAKAIMDLHGGQIWATSEGCDRGSCFSVQLPLAPARTPAVTELPRDESGNGHGARILLVEDHADTARVLARLLSHLGHVVRTAHTVTTALRLADAEEFDVLVSDIGLPDATGYELMEQIRAHHNDLVGIAISGYGMESDLAKSRDAGFVEHLVKPVNLPTLQSIIQRVVKGATSLARSS